jgi:hypothetical protein
MRQAGGEPSVLRTSRKAGSDDITGPGHGWHGTLWGLVVARLREAGCPVRVLSRRARNTSDGAAQVAGDLLTGASGGPAPVPTSPTWLHGVRCLIVVASCGVGNQPGTSDAVCLPLGSGVAEDRC